MVSYNFPSSNLDSYNSTYLIQDHNLRAFEPVWLILGQNCVYSCNDAWHWERMIWLYYILNKSEKKHVKKFLKKPKLSNYFPLEPKNFVKSHTKMKKFYELELKFFLCNLMIFIYSHHMFRRNFHKKILAC